MLKEKKYLLQKEEKKTSFFHIELNRVRTYKILFSIMKESALTNLATQAFNIYTTFFNKKFFFIGYIISDFFRIQDKPGDVSKQRICIASKKSQINRLIRKELEFCDDSRFLPTLTTQSLPLCRLGLTNSQIKLGISSNFSGMRYSWLIL